MFNIKDQQVQSTVHDFIYSYEIRVIRKAWHTARSAFIKHEIIIIHYLPCSFYVFFSSYETKAKNIMLYKHQLLKNMAIVENGVISALNKFKNKINTHFYLHNTLSFLQQHSHIYVRICVHAYIILRKRASIPVNVNTLIQYNVRVQYCAHLSYTQFVCLSIVYMLTGM